MFFFAQIGCLPLRDFSKENEHFLGWRRFFPLWGSRHFGPSARSQKFAIWGMTPKAISLRLWASSISPLKSPHDPTPNCRQNGHPKTTQCTTLARNDQHRGARVYGGGCFSRGPLARGVRDIREFFADFFLRDLRGVFEKFFSSRQKIWGKNRHI